MLEVGEPAPSTVAEVRLSGTRFDPASTVLGKLAERSGHGRSQ
jgi:hypothetical protein